MALSTNTLDEAVRPELFSEWLEVKKLWFPREDTIENIAYDKRTPGKYLYFTKQSYCTINFFSHSFIITKRIFCPLIYK